MKSTRLIIIISLAAVLFPALVVAEISRGNEIQITKPKVTVNMKNISTAQTMACNNAIDNFYTKYEQTIKCYKVIMLEGAVRAANFITLNVNNGDIDAVPFLLRQQISAAIDMHFDTHYFNFDSEEIFGSVVSESALYDEMEDCASKTATINSSIALSSAIAAVCDICNEGKPKFEHVDYLCPITPAVVTPLTPAAPIPSK